MRVGPCAPCTGKTGSFSAAPRRAIPYEGPLRRAGRPRLPLKGGEPYWLPAMAASILDAELTSWWVPREGKVCASRSEEHTSELQSLMRLSYAVFCLINKTTLLHNINSYPIIIFLIRQYYSHCAT